VFTSYVSKLGVLIGRRARLIRCDPVSTHITPFRTKSTAHSQGLKKAPFFISLFGLSIGEHPELQDFRSPHSIQGDSDSIHMPRGG
jgi:hypothetical protein